MRHETAIFGPKNQNTEVQLSFFAYFLLLQQQKTQNIAETTIL